MPAAGADHADPAAGLAPLPAVDDALTLRRLLAAVLAENGALLGQLADAGRRLADDARRRAAAAELATALEAARADAVAARTAAAEAEGRAAAEAAALRGRAAEAEAAEAAARAAAAAAEADGERRAAAAAAAEGARDDALDALAAAQARVAALGCENDAIAAQLEAAGTAAASAAAAAAAGTAAAGATHDRAEEADLMTRKFEAARGRVEELEAAAALETEVVRDWATLLHTVRRALEQEVVIARTCPSADLRSARDDTAVALQRYREHVQHVVERSRERVAAAAEKAAADAGPPPAAGAGVGGKKQRLSAGGRGAAPIAAFPAYALTPLGDLLLYVAALAERINEATAPAAEPLGFGAAAQPNTATAKQWMWGSK